MNTETARGGALCTHRGLVDVPQEADDVLEEDLTLQIDDTKRDW